MDKKYYCRILGITKEDPSLKEIKEAYEERIYKLNSADYADDSEYARKKIKQAEMAYKVLTGAAPGISKKQREFRFEKLKDAIERREGADLSEEAEYSEQRYEKHEERKKRSKFEPRRLKEDSTGDRTYTPKAAGPHIGGTMTYSTGKKKVIVLVIIAAVVILIGVTGVIATQVTSNFTQMMTGQFEDDYSSAGRTLSEDEIASIDSASEFCLNTDFYAGLDMSTVQKYAGSADMSEGEGQYGEADVYDGTFNILFNLGITNVSGFYDYITDEDDYYFLYDDKQCAETLIKWMNAPSYEEVAGATDKYTSEPILTLSEYMEYLERITYEKYEKQWSV